MKVKKVRMPVILAVVLGCFIVCIWALCLKLYLEERQSPVPKGGIGESYIVHGYSSQASGVLNAIVPLDIKWLEYSSADIAMYVANLSQAEAGRRELAVIRAQAQQHFLDEQAALMQQQREMQERLDTKAQQDIADMGGVDATTDDVVYGTPRPEIVVPQVTVPVESALPSLSPSPEVTEDTGYYGQFKASFVCTCASCFKPDDWPGVQSGANYILADPEYLSPGIVVTLDAGSAGEFEVKDADGLITGRSLIVFNANHSEANGSMVLYPKVSKKN